MVVSYIPTKSTAGSSKVLSAKAMITAYPCFYSSTPTLAQCHPLQLTTPLLGLVFSAPQQPFHLSKQEPSPSIILIDQTPYPCPLAASHDINKIIQADFSDRLYCKLALQAQKSWRDDPIFQPYYHQTGMVIVDDKGLGGRIIETHKQLGARCEAETFGSDELKWRFDGIYQDIQLQGVKDVFFNPLSVWAEATSVLGKVMEVAVERGVKYITACVVHSYL